MIAKWCVKLRPNSPARQSDCGSYRVRRTMLYLLLYHLHKVHPGFNVLRYETFRSVVAGLAALALSLALGPLLIERFRSAVSYTHLTLPTKA